MVSGTSKLSNFLDHVPNRFIEILNPVSIFSMIWKGGNIGLVITCNNIEDPSTARAPEIGDCSGEFHCDL
jgi:hypothetical protein